ncbi:UNVERIFIED_CONTAM: hypothetical protein Slati_3503500 [Sesamum latifolium]|uniref:Transposase n=1 Tax=Sesamum latifolium TaxID=2727402 RepID=A0AAW2UL37_9LAMI
MQNIFNKYATTWLSKTFSEAKEAGIQPNWLGNDIWHQLQAYWNSDEFKVKSTKNKANRVAKPAAANNVYRGGSSSVGMHKRKLKAQLGRPPNRMEVFVNCYKKKANGTWSGKRAEEVVEIIRSCLRSVSLSPRRGRWAHRWYCCSSSRRPVVGSGCRREKAGMSLRHGSDALISDVAQPWTTEARPSSSTAAPSPIDTKLDKIILVLNALCTKMGMPHIFVKVQSTTDALVEGAAQLRMLLITELSDEPEALD